MYCCLTSSGLRVKCSVFTVVPQMVQVCTRVPGESSVAGVLTVQSPGVCSARGSSWVTSCWQRVQKPVSVPGSEQVEGVSSVHWATSCPRAVPVVSPQRVQVEGSVQVASVQVCPKASPSVSPHWVQVLGVVQVASSH